MRPNTSQPKGNSILRIRFWYVALLLLFGVFLVRLFYLQVIRHDFYQKAALSTQLKQYELPAQRGAIAAYSNGQIVPLVLNETLYTLYSDPKFVKDPKSAAEAVQRIIGGDTKEYERLMRLDTRYSVLGKKLSKDQSKQIEALKLKGIGTRDAQFRTYPQGALAAQVLGFVNDEGEGKYGLEQALNAELKGKNGQLKAITDAQGVPLATNKENIVTEAVSGKRVVLTIDIGMQQQLEEILKKGVENAKGKAGSAIILDSKTGAIKAMANYPSYNPAEFYKVENGEVFNNTAISSPLEIGSIMKPLVAAASLDSGSITPNSTYYDSGAVVVGDAVIKNAGQWGSPGTKTIDDVIRLSLNVGATWMLQQMGDGELNQKGRGIWYDYMKNHYRLGAQTGVELANEGSGFIPDPNEGDGLNIRYANTTFGQGMTATMLQMASAFSSATNGGTYYQPHITETTDQNGVVVKSKAAKYTSVSAETSQALRSSLTKAWEANFPAYNAKSGRQGYQIGTKSGSAQIASPDGGYYSDRYNGTFEGFVAGGSGEYVINVLINEPKIDGFAGSKAAAPVFVSIADMIIDNFGLTPMN